jgi:hypothetical protein
MRPFISTIAAATLLVACTHRPTSAVDQTKVADPLRTPADFAAIADAHARSVALYGEVSRVIESPRCLNCHPATRRPTQGDDLHPHVPYVLAGIEGHGTAGVTCATCHQSANVATFAEPATIPGNPRWALAPASMAWQGKSRGDICRQIKDPARNGGHTLAQIHHHMAEDKLVGWAWTPGMGRKPAPGTQAALGDLLTAWIETGAACPEG